MASVPDGLEIFTRKLDAAMKFEGRGATIVFQSQILCIFCPVYYQNRFHETPTPKDAGPMSSMVRGRSGTCGSRQHVRMPWVEVPEPEDMENRGSVAFKDLDLEEEAKQCVLRTSPCHPQPNLLSESESGNREHARQKRMQPFPTR